MLLPRRRFLRLAAAAAALPAASRSGWAQAYPSRPLRLIVGYPAGGSSDILARLMGQWLSERLGQPVVVENRPGAGTNIATEAVVRAAPDGYTLLMVTAANVINATLYEKLSFNFIRDMAPIAYLGREPNGMLINPSVPANSVTEFIAYAKANPGKVSMASGGTGASSHVSGELFKMLTGISMQHIPYRGAAPALTDLLAGQVQLYFGPLLAAIEHVKTGKLRALAVTSSTRSAILPDVPMVAEFVPGYESSQIYGFAAPKDTPGAIVDKLNKDVNAGLVDPKIKARFTELGATIVAGSSADFGKVIAEETEKWAKVVKFSGAKAD